MGKPSFPSLPILLVDDDPMALRLIDVALRGEGVDNIVMCDDSRCVMALIAATDFSVVSLDLSMPHVSGKELLNEIAKLRPDLTLIVITASSDAETADECVKLGAFDYIRKADIDSLAPRILRAIRHRELVGENTRLKRSLIEGRLVNPAAFEAIVTGDEKLLNIFKYAEAVAGTNRAVLIRGETGVGKELLSEAIHKASGRAGAFVTVNTSGLDEQMFSDTIFGHEKGAFTGADRRRPGLVEAAADGTLFLDEIGDLGSDAQIKLLRFLQDGKFYPLGSDAAKLSTARVIAATNRHLEDLVQRDAFRKDLYYRLQAHQIELPPLCERRADVPILVRHFVKTAGGAASFDLDKFARSLAGYDFPGNVRELQGLVADAVLAGGLDAPSVRRALAGRMPAAASPSVPPPSAAPLLTPPTSTAFPEKLPLADAWLDLLMDEALRRARGNKTLAAKMIGVSRQSIYRHRPSS